MNEPGDFREGSAPHEVLEQVMSAFVRDPASPHTIDMQQTIHLAELIPELTVIGSAVDIRKGWT